MSKIPKDEWKCQKCEETFKVERPNRPTICPNPNCDNSKHFDSLSGPWQYFDGKKFVPKLLADDIMNDYHFVTVDDSWEIFVYCDGIYQEGAEFLIREVAEQKLDVKTRTNRKNEVVDYVRDGNFVSREKFNNPHNLIAVENGLLDVRTRKLEDFDPEKLILTKIPVEYNPDADCPKIKEFLYDVTWDDRVPTLVEFAGYCLLKNYPFHKALMLTGEGENGKSKYLSLLRRFLGADNVSSPSLHDILYNRFAKADLFGKLANIHADIPQKKLKTTGPFKMLTGQDPIWGEKKHKDAFQFDNHAKLLFSANEIPETEDKTRAFYRRWVLVGFPYLFVDDPDPDDEFQKKKDPNILDRITTPEELSGFLNWALDGLENLLEREKFTGERSIEEKTDLWELKSDPIQAFIARDIIVDPEIFATKDEIYVAYSEYCRENDRPPLDKNVFSRRLPKYAPVEKYRPKIKGKRIQCWKGLALKENPKRIEDVKGVKGTFTFNRDFKNKNKSPYDNDNTPDIPDIGVDDDE